MTILGNDPDRWTGDIVWLDQHDYDVPLRRELGRTLQLPDTLMSWNREGDRVWVQLSDGADTRAWVNAALAELGRPALP